MLIIEYTENIFRLLLTDPPSEAVRKMSRALTCFLLALAISSACCTTYTKSQIREIFSAGKECMRTLNIPLQSDIIERVLYNRNVVKEEETLKYMECASKKMGWIDNEGKLVIPPMIEYFSRNALQKYVEEVLEQCKIFYEGTNVGEKMFNYHQCYFENKKF
nr:LOW QUALITY PROTEIN: uncharacterized protein LOC115255056 [Aedes albopictus]